MTNPVDLQSSLAGVRPWYLPVFVRDGTAIRLI